MSNYFSPRDLAGEVCFNPNFFQTRARINYLIDNYLSLEILCDRLKDLPIQWRKPQPRQWQKIKWENINSEEIIGIKLDVFLSIIKGALYTEEPIRGYTQTSRQYLAPIHPQMARFVGGSVTDKGIIQEIGLWEKEERQHTPALLKIYQQLTSEKITPNLRVVKSYQPSPHPYADLYRHGLHRIATEYAAVCLYLLLMSRTTGTIQQVFQELLKDEVNHMTKFWGFGLWLYPNSAGSHTRSGSKNLWQSLSPLISTFTRMMLVLNWASWTSITKIELIYTFARVFLRMRYWSNCLTSYELQQIFDSSQVSENTKINS